MCRDDDDLGATLKVFMPTRFAKCTMLSVTGWEG